MLDAITIENGGGSVAGLAEIVPLRSLQRLGQVQQEQGEPGIRCWSGWVVPEIHPAGLHQFFPFFARYINEQVVGLSKQSPQRMIIPNSGHESAILCLSDDLDDRYPNRTMMINSLSTQFRGWGEPTSALMRLYLFVVWLMNCQLFLPVEFWRVIVARFDGIPGICGNRGT